MGVMRFTIIDATKTVSFIGPNHGAKVLTAACSTGPTNLDALLAAAEPYDRELVTYLRDGLANFDEHNAPGNFVAIHDRLRAARPVDQPPFRVVDEATRTASVTPVGYGLILFNLTAQRIVQVQNSYSTLLRRDRGRIRAAGRPTRHLYRYELPGDWRIVP